MSSKPHRRKLEEANQPGRTPKRFKRDVFEQSNACSELFNTIRSTRDAEGRPITDTLQRAPSRRNDPGYHDVVDKPIDLSRISQKVNGDEYNSFDEFCADIELLIQNTVSFYKPETLEYKHAMELQKVFELEKERLLSNGDNSRLSSTPSSTSFKGDAKPEDWRMEAVVASLLQEHDNMGRLLCPPFRVLAPPEVFPLYYEYIDKPIDLKTIANKIRISEYNRWSDFEADLKLMFKNAKTFNEPTSEIHKDAQFLNGVAKRKLTFYSSCKKPMLTELNQNKQLINELLSQEYNEEGSALEDSDEEDVESASDQFSELYNKVRNVTFNNIALCEPFLSLPDRQYYPDYFEDISNPISLYLINNRIKKEMYSTLKEMADDLQLMCRNAMTYNIEGSEIYDSAVRLDEFVIQTVREMDPTIVLEKTFVEISPEDDDDDDEKTFDNSKLPSDSKESSMGLISHKPSVGSDDGMSVSDIGGNPGSPKKKYKRAIPPSRLPGAAETRLQLIGKREKRGGDGQKMRPGRKSFNELRELYKGKLLEVYRTIFDYAENGRQLCEDFMYRPNPTQYPDYYVVIENPIDMTTIRHRIENAEYKTSDEFMDDFRLLFRNAKTYNRPDSQIYMNANTLEKLSVKTMADVSNKIVLQRPPPSKRTPTQFTELGSPPGAAVQSTSRRQPSEAKSTPSRALSSRLQPFQIKMNDILRRIVDFKNEEGRQLSSIFQKLPSRLDYPPYYEVIKKPMDLLRISQKISNDQYDSIRAFFTDLKLVFENACKFNEPDSDIYKDALTLQKEIIEIISEDEDKINTVPSVPQQIHRILTNLLVAVTTYTEKGRCLSNSFADITDVFRKHEIPLSEMPFTLDQIKTNLDRHRYKRLDRFQEDAFALFSRIRSLTRPDSQLFMDSVELQKYFISKRDELCKGVLISPASAFTESDLYDEVAARKKELKHEKNKTDNEESHEEEPMEEDKTTTAEEIPSVEKDDITYTPNSYVYVASGDEGDQRHIFRVEKIVRDVDEPSSLLLKGLWVFKPSETFHLATRKFYPNEVFLTAKSGSVTVDRLRGKCIVLFIDDYLSFKPTEFLESDVYVCESRYLGRKLHFKRLNAWPYADEVKEIQSEPRPPEYAIQKTVTSELISDTKTLSKAESEEMEEDERMRDLPPVLDVFREDVIMRKRIIPAAGDIDVENSNATELNTSKDVIYYEQIKFCDRFYRIGDAVLVFNPKKPQCDVMRIDRIWETPDGQRNFSGMFFARPKEVIHEPSTCFYHREVIAVEQPDRVEPIENIQNRCAILNVKQYASCRPTEVPECDVFVVDHKVSGDSRSTDSYMTYHSGKVYRKLKTYSWSEAVPDDEVFYFKSNINMDREISPQMDNSLPIEISELDAEESHVVEPMESPTTTKDSSWLAAQPKLNAKSKSGYILFSAEIRKRIMSENPEAGFGEVSKIVGVEWKKLSDEQKRQYESRANFIAEERAKTEITPNNKVLLPGEIRIHLCRWNGCDFQFDSSEGLMAHVSNDHASTDDAKHIDEQKNEALFMCLWLTCGRYRANGKPFPSLPRLMRHVREKHLASAVKVTQPNLRGKHYFHYIQQEGKEGLFVNQPNGIHRPDALPQKSAVPLDGGRPASSASQPPPTPTQALHTPNHSTQHHQVYVHQPAPQANGTAQVVQLVNGTGVSYAPYQTVILNQTPQHQIVTSAGHQSSGQIVVHHQPAPHQIVVHGNGTPATLGQSYGAHPAPGPVIAHEHGISTAAAHPYYPHSSSHQQSSYIPTHSNMPHSDRNAVVSASPRPEPMFIPPPNSVKVRRVLHSEVYLRYIETLSQTKQRTQSKYDRSLATSHGHTYERRRLPVDLIAKEALGKHREEEVVRALWRLRDNMLESVLGIQREHDPPLV